MYRSNCPLLPLWFIRQMVPLILYSILFHMMRWVHDSKTSILIRDDGWNIQEYTSNIPIYMEVLSLATPKSPIAFLISWSSTLKCIRWNEKVHLGCSMLCFLQNLRWCRIVLDWVGRAIIIYFKSWHHTVYI